MLQLDMKPKQINQWNNLKNLMNIQHSSAGRSVGINLQIFNTDDVHVFHICYVILYVCLASVRIDICKNSIYLIYVSIYI